MAGKKQLDPQEALSKMRNVLDDMPANLITRPVVPPMHMVGEANALYLVADRLREALTAVGVAEHLIDELPSRAQALAAAQAQRSLAPAARRSAEELKAEEEAYNLRRDLTAAGRYSLRKNVTRKPNAQHPRSSRECPA